MTRGRIPLSISMFIFTLIAVGAGALISSIGVVTAQAYTPPSQVKINMYQLTASGARVFPYILCTTGSTAQGCSRGTNYPYPFTSSQVTVQIEGAGNTQGYLRNVVPSEITIETFAQHSIAAQAIAARTYVYWHLKDDPARIINNSTEFQAFIPRTYDALSAANKSLVDQAVAPRYYMSRSNSTAPIFSEFFADIRTRTLSGDAPPGAHPYLVPVEYPISSHPDISPTPDGHGHGMSQKGASRWANGNLTYDRTKNLGKWSTSFTHPFEILEHYYTGIHIRNANSANAILTPQYRWAPLRARWDNPPVANPSRLTVCPGEQRQLEIWAQNTGTVTWPANASVRLDSQTIGGIQAAGSLSPIGKTYVPSQPVPPGGTFVGYILVEFPPGTPSGTISLAVDMYQDVGNDVWVPFRYLSPAPPTGGQWPAYFKADFVLDPSCMKSYSPFVTNSPTKINTSH